MAGLSCLPEALRACLPSTPSPAPKRVDAAEPSSTYPDAIGGYRQGEFPLPLDEEDRMRVLTQLDVLDTAAEKSFDSITDWGRRFYDVPICIITLVDRNRQWFKSCYGLDVNQTGRDAAFCAHAIMPGAPEIFEVPDACADTRFANNPLVVGAPFTHRLSPQVLSPPRLRLFGDGARQGRFPLDRNSQY